MVTRQEEEQQHGNTLSLTCWGIFEQDNVKCDMNTSFILEVLCCHPCKSVY